MLQQVWLSVWDMREIYIPEIVQLHKGLNERVIAGFDHIDQEADRLADDHYKRACESPCGDDVDVEMEMARAAEAAEDIGAEHYGTAKRLEQSILNLATIAYAHTFEQQFLLFHRKVVAVHDPKYQKKQDCFGKFEPAKECLKTRKIDIETISTWPLVGQLRQAANVAKHAEGPSSDRLKKDRPDLFVNPSIRDMSIDPQTKQPLYPIGAVVRPLTGEDFYVTRADLEIYADALLTFWLELANRVDPGSP